MKSVSVIIPVYNVEKYLPKCLDSVIGQTYREIEIICVNDGSPDNSAEILENYAEKDSRIKIITQKNQGLSGARNTGIKNATGYYTVFLDSDDWLDLDTIEAAVSAAEKNAVETVMWGYTREFADKSLEKKIFDGDRIFDEEGTRTLHRRLAGLMGDELANPENTDALVTAWGKLYRTEIIKENNLGFVDTKIIGTEDLLFNIHYFGFIKSCAFLDKPFSHYRKDNETSLTRSYKSKLFSQWSELYSRIRKYLNENSLGEDFHAALDNRICLSMIGLGLNELCNKASHGERIKNLKKILNSEQYIKAYKNLEFAYFPIHWKIFFILCKKRCAVGVYVLLNAMQMMIGK